MTVSDWVGETASNMRKQSVRFTLKHTAHTMYLGGVRRLSPLFPDGHDFWLGDWDVLVILDACRPDLMREACTSTSYDWLPAFDELVTVRSPASSSRGWMEAHFDENHEREVSRTGYITSNLFVREYQVERFATFNEVLADLELADSVRLVEPRKLTDQAVNVWRNRDTLDVGRLIVHYMQPHTPFRSHPEWFTDADSSTGWGLGFVELRDGKLNPEAFREAYLDNLLWVLEDIDLLVHNCDANITVTADHGNGLGEWGIYGHPNGIPLDVVREVPWIQVSGTDERTYKPELPDGYLEQHHNLTEDDVKDQLKALGYSE